MKKANKKSKTPDARPNAPYDGERLAYSVSDFCKAVGLGRTKTYELIEKGRLSVIKVGRRTLIAKSSINDFLSSGGSGGDK